MKKLLFIFIVLSVVSVTVFGTDVIDTEALEESLNGVEYNTSYDSIGDMIDDVLNNRLRLNGKNIIENILELLFRSIGNALPLFSGMLSVAVLISTIQKLEILSGKTESACLLGGRIIFTVILLNGVLSYVLGARCALEGISSFTSVLSPILATLLASCGARGTVSTLAPSSVLLSSFLIELIVKLVLPLVVMCCIIASIDNLLPESKLKGISQAVKSITTWIIGGVFTVFSAIIALQGIVAGITDGISIRGIKYALSTSVPIIGGSISESFSAVLLSGFYLKGAIGVVGIITVLGIIIIPILNIMALNVLLSLFSGVIRPFSDEVIVRQINGVIELLKLVAASLIGVGVLWFVYLGMLACAGGSYI